MQMLCNPQYEMKAAVYIVHLQCDKINVIQITKISVCIFKHLQQCPCVIFLCQWIPACFSSAIFFKTN